MPSGISGANDWKAFHRPPQEGWLSAKGRMISPTPSIEALLALWIAAFNSHDLDAHMELYAEDATLFGSVGGLQIGRSTIRTYFGNRGPNVRVKSYPPPRVAMLGPDIALTAGHVDFQNAAELIPYRMTWVLVRRDGNWRIAQHHGSPRVGASPIEDASA